MDHPFHRGGDQNITFLLQESGSILKVFGSRKILHAANLRLMGVHSLHIQAVVVHDGSVALQDGYDLGPVFLLKELCRVVADVAKALHADVLTFETAVKPS